MHILRESGDDEAKATTKPFMKEGGEAPTATATSPPGKAAGKNPASFSSRLLISLGVVLSSLFIFFVVSKRIDMRENKKYLSLMRRIPITPGRLYILSMLM
jgi:hypothetical protein